MSCRRVAPKSCHRTPLRVIGGSRLADGSATRDGLGVFMSEIDGHPNLMHEGGIPGFNSILVYFPSEKLTIAVLSNSPAASAGELAAEIAREAFGTKAPG